MSVSAAFFTSRLLARVASPKYVISAQSRRFMSTLTLDEKFKITQDRSGEVFPDASNQEKLKVYSLFKQATEGKNTKKKPSAMDFEGSAKWKAWNKLGDLPQEEAKQQYVDFVNQLLTAAGKDPVA